MAAGSEWDDHDLVFAQPNGKPIDLDNQSKAWKAFLKRVGVSDARLHDARHTAATLPLLQGVDPLASTSLNLETGQHLRRAQKCTLGLVKKSSTTSKPITWKCYFHA